MVDEKRCFVFGEDDVVYLHHDVDNDEIDALEHNMYSRVIFNVNLC